ncbi:MAG: transporter substrate-binding domain-containing protein [Spirochaetales bacterium]|nr:transporter substrate-binding domain-containing protein [Spirochaetales bacterium]
MDNIDNIELWYNPEFPPLEYADSEGNFVGMGADIFALIEERLGVTFNKRLSNDWNEQLSSLRDGTSAIAPTIVENSVREEYLNFTTPYAVVEIVIITDNEERRHLGLSDLKDYRVAVVSGFATEDYISDNMKFFNEIITVKNNEEGLRAVSFGQVDAFIGNIAVASYHINRLGITNLKVAGELDYNFSFSIGISKKYPELHTIIQKALSEIRDEEIDEIKSRYITLTAHTGLSPENKRWFILGTAVVGFMLISILLISLGLKKRLNKNIQILNDEQLKSLQNAERYRALFFNAPIALLEMQKNGEIVQVNKTFTDKFGYTIEDLPHLDNWWELAYADEQIRRNEREAWEIAQSDGYMLESAVEYGSFELRGKDGSNRVFIISINMAAENYIFSFMDIDEQQKMAAELKKSRDNFYTLFELAPFTCVVTDFNGIILDTNQHFCRQNGKTKDRIVGKTNKDLGRLLNPEISQKVVEDLKINGFSPLKEISIKFGAKEIWVLFASQVIDWSQGKAILSVTIDITDKKSVELELQENRNNLEKIVFDRTRELEEAIQERKEKESQLIQAEKMASVGLLTAGISHEINNPLNYLMGAYVNLADYFKSSGNQEEAIAFLLDGMKEGIDRAAAIVKGLNQLSRDSRAYDEDCNINEIIDNCLLVLQNKLKDRIVIIQDYQNGSNHIEGNIGKLHQVFLNILNNACQAIENEGKITIVVGKSEAQTEITIADNGCGIAPEELSKIVEPFYTTRAPGDGIGLGLSICYNIIQEHNGRLEIASEPGMGTTVSIHL